jgi:hypothetical protein
MKKSAFLDITSFTYIGSIGAEHYYGKIIFTDKSIERFDLQHPLTQKEAIHLNKKDGDIKIFHRYKRGELSDRFETENDVINYGIKLFKEKYSDYILILGNNCARSAVPLIYWPNKLNKLAVKINKLADKWEKIGGYEGNDKLAGKIDNEWNNLLKNYL